MKPRVLIVDDAIYMRITLQDILERNDIKVVAMAQNGEVGLNIYKELYETNQKPDLVLMDITMKKMDGITALKEIKKIDRDAKVVMCTSVKSKEATVEAVQAGAIYFIEKPFDDDVVINIVKKALAYKR